jgi:hypothetical protein
MEWSASKLSRIESGESPILARDVRLLCTLLGADDSVGEALVELAKNVKAKGWWTAYRDVLMGNYLPFEAEAAEVNEFQLELVTGLLQIPAYTRAIMRSAWVDASEEEIERRVQVRQDRQPALDRQDRPLRLWAIMSEGALRRQIGGPQVMREQLLHVAKRAEQPNVDVQVLPFEAGAHPSIGLGFTILRFADADPLVFHNAFRQEPEVDDPAERQYALVTFDRLRAQAESPERSRRIIQEAAYAIG